MARFKHGVMGPISGKIGGTVAANWKGIPYVRSRPGFRTKTRKDREAKNQTKFSDMHWWLQPILVFLREGFKGYGPTLEGFNAAKSYNLRNAFVMQEEKWVLDPSLVLVSHGDVKLPENISCSLYGNELHFSWDVKDSIADSQFDQAMLLAYDPENEKEEHMITSEFRKSGSAMIKVFTPGNYHVYIAFRAHDRSRQSNSQYLGVVSV
jgi:hypothetical protein